MRYYIVDQKGEIVNVIEWDGVSPWSPPAGCTAVGRTDQLPRDEFHPPIPIKPALPRWRELLRSMGFKC